jgi:hypothetical protein
MDKRGKSQKTFQSFRCINGHQIVEASHGRWTPSFIEHVLFVYINSLSLNTTIELIREQYEDDILTKELILDFIIAVSDSLPTLDEADLVLQPIRSNYLAFDGVWFKILGEETVLIVCFDPITFDIVSAQWSPTETQKAYEDVMTEAVNKIGATNVKGLYADGDRGFMAAWKHLLPTIPFQLCVFHKELRMGQIVPIKSVSRSKQMDNKTKHDIRVFQLLFRDAIYSDTKDECWGALLGLERYCKSDQHDQSERFMKAYRSLKHNFIYTLTHFDHPHMKRDNNMIENFNGCMKPRLKLMRGFKKEDNLDRYLKLFIFDYRFHVFKGSEDMSRRNRSPLQCADVFLPKFYNFLTFLRTTFNTSYVLKKP